MDLDNSDFYRSPAADSFVLENRCDQVHHLLLYSVLGGKPLYAGRLWKVLEYFSKFADLAHIYSPPFQILEVSLSHHCTSALRRHCRQALCVWGRDRKQNHNLHHLLGT